jgi:prepilin-type N-terminal cleavage/methylation domain-containing protein
MITKGRQGQTGFTLIEMMILIAIIGIMATIIYPYFEKYNNEGKYVESMKTDISAIRDAEEKYFAQYSKYTSEVADLTNFGYKGVSGGNSVKIDAASGISKDFIITVTSSKTTKKVVYNSVSGQITTN